MHGPTTSRLVAATVTAVAAGLLATGCSDGSSDRTDPTAGPSSPPTSAAAAGPVHLVGSAATLEAGTYQAAFLTGTGRARSEAVLDVPDGYREGDHGDDWYVVSRDGDTFLGLWVVDTVDRDACRGEEDAVDPGPTVRDLARALVAQRSTRAPAPKRVTVDGHAGAYVELTAPTRLARCGEHPALWRSPERPIYSGGQVDRVWILDVDGQRLVVDASYAPGSSAQEREDLTAMVGSLRIVAAEGA